MVLIYLEKQFATCVYADGCVYILREIWLQVSGVRMQVAGNCISATRAMVAEVDKADTRVTLRPRTSENGRTF